MIEIVPVSNHLEIESEFATFPWQIYRHDPLWVPPLLGERIKLIDPATRCIFQARGSQNSSWHLKDGKLAGTICCADDKETNAARGMKDCMIGFFDCIEDRDGCLGNVRPCQTMGQDSPARDVIRTLEPGL